MTTRRVLGIGCLLGLVAVPACTPSGSPTAARPGEAGPKVVAADKGRGRPNPVKEPARPAPPNDTPVDPTPATPKLRTTDWVERLTIEGGDGHASRIDNVAFSPDSNTVVSSGVDGTVKVWDAATAKLRHTIPTGDDGPPGPVAFISDGKAMVYGSNRDLGVTFADPATGQVLRRLRDPADKVRNGSRGAVNALAITRDGKTLVTGGTDDTVRILDLQTGALRHAIPADMYSVQGLAFSPDERTLVAVGGSGFAGTIRLYDAATRKELAAAKNPDRAFEAVAFSPDGALLATASAGNEITLWDVAGGAKIKEVASFRGHAVQNPAAHCVAFTGDGRTLLAGSGTEFDGGMLQFIDVAARRVRESVACSHGVRCVALSPDGRSMVVGTLSGVNLSAAKDTPGKLILWSKVR